MSANRLITLTGVPTLSIKEVVETWRFDTFQFSDSEALHRVLCIRDPGTNFKVEFEEALDGYPAGTERLG